MRITVQVVGSEINIPIDNEIISLDVFPDMTLADVKALVEGDTNIPAEAQHFFFNSRQIADASQTLEQLQVKDGDMFGLAVRDPARLGQRPRAAAGGRSQRRQRQGPDPESLRLQLVGDARIRANIRRSAPDLADAADDKDKFHDLFDQHQRRLAQAQAEREAHQMALNADPFNIEAQREIEEMIRMERVNENIQEALQNNPELFGRVTMLYISVEVNGFPVKAFVDSGAQSTIMSPDCAERCNIMRLIDHRYAGIAKGVGTAKIIGRVHSADIQIGTYSLPCSFTVMEGKDVDLLLGLDMLKRHQMEISLKDNCLRIGEASIPFLSEADIPKAFEEALADEPMITGPEGVKVGARTGVVEPPSESAAPAPAPSTTQGRSAADSSQSSMPATQPYRPAVAPPAGVTADAINKVTELGFSREEAVHALEQVGGDVELAIGLLL